MIFVEYATTPRYDAASAILYSPLSVPVTALERFTRTHPSSRTQTLSQEYLHESQITLRLLPVAL